MPDGLMPAVPSPAGSMSVVVVYAPAPREVRHQGLALPAGSSLAQALPALARALDLPVATLTALDAGIWGQRCAPTRVLAQGDRIEFYRPLRVDPKVARRERFIRQGAKSAGLFATRRPGAKAGY